MRIPQIKTYHLLVSADDTQLCRRGAIRRNETLAIDAAGFKLIPQTPAVIILPHKAGNTRFTAKQRKVVRHIGCPSQSFLRTEHMGNRHRSFRRDTVYFAIVVFIQHNITDNEDPALRCTPVYKII